MTISLVLRGTLADRAVTASPGASPAPLPEGRGEIEVGDDVTVTDLVAHLGLPSVPYVIVVNGAAVHKSSRLPGGARVEIHPPMAGG